MLVQTFGYGVNLYGSLICPDMEQVVVLLNKAPNYKKAVMEMMEVASDSELLAMDYYDVLDAIDPNNTDNFAIATILANVINEAEGTSLIATWDEVNSDANLLVHEYTDCTWGEYLGNKRMEYIPLEKKLDELIFRYLKMVRKNVMCEFELQHWTKEVADVPSDPQSAADSAEKVFYVETPIGKIRVAAKGKGAADGFPGVYVDFVKENGELIQLACTEFDPNEGTLCSEVFPGGDNVVTRFAHDCLPCTEEAIDTQSDPLEKAKALINRFILREYKGEPCFDRLDAVGIAHTYLGDDEDVEIQVNADLINFRIVTYLSPVGGESVCVERTQYASLQEMNEKIFPYLNFHGLIDIDDDLWAKFDESSIGREWLRTKFPAGTRVRLEYMCDMQAPPAGTEGIIDHVDDKGSIHVRWDTGSSLALIYGMDVFTVIKEEQK